MYQVQLLYHDASLGRPVNFVLKRLEILHEDANSLSRPHDIDRFLSSFCSWQRTQNPPGDQDPQHWDHALILTGLDLYVVSKHGKISSQVVGKQIISILSNNNFIQLKQQLLLLKLCLNFRISTSSWYVYLNQQLYCKRRQAF